MARHDFSIIRELFAADIRLFDRVYRHGDAAVIENYVPSSGDGKLLTGESGPDLQTEPAAAESRISGKTLSWIRSWDFTVISEWENWGFTKISGGTGRKWKGLHCAHYQYCPMCVWMIWWATKIAKKN